MLIASSLHMYATFAVVDTASAVFKHQSNRFNVGVHAHKDNNHNRYKHNNTISNDKNFLLHTLCRILTTLR